MKKYFIKIVSFSMIIGLLSCETLDLETQNSPNSLTPENADVDYFINSAELGLATYFEGNPNGFPGAFEYSRNVVRQEHMFGPLYDNAFTPGNFDNHWNRAYRDLLADVYAAIPLAEEKGWSHHAGIAKVIKSYVYVSLVDMFGEVPYEEAFNSDILNPNVSTGSLIYDESLAMLDDAIADFGDDEAPVVSGDLFYGGDTEKWIALANTLKIRLLLQKRLVDNTVGAQIQSIVNTGNIMTSQSNDFEFRWSTNNAAPDSRHVNFVDNYISGANDYMANGYMNLFLTTNDPRLRYYFYRQTLTNTTDPNELPCITANYPSHYAAVGAPFCQLPNGYWGRDHGRADGIPPDNLLRTQWGLYPIGGQFDDDQGIPGTATSGASGAGISPFFLYNYSLFLRAEAALMLSTGEDARSLLSAAIDGSMDKVRNFNTSVSGGATNEPVLSDFTDYRDAILGLYDGAGSNEERLEIIVTEYYKASHGNGIEAFNAYRRTGYPSNMQPMEINPGGQFIRTFFYSSNLVNRNSSVDQKVDLQTKVFWDDGSKTLN